MQESILIRKVFRVVSEWLPNQPTQCAPVSTERNYNSLHCNNPPGQQMEEYQDTESI